LPSSFKNQTITTTNKEYKMKKTLLALLTIALAFTAIVPAQAQDERVLVIIDSAINSNNFPSIIHEVCFTGQNVIANPVLCPNGSTFMEGKGSAAVKWPSSINNGIYHGDQMVKSALTVNSNTKIVFIRISNTDKNGNQNMLSSQITSLVSAISWVEKNAERFSIDAVSISQSSVNSTNLLRCSNDLVTINAVSSLNAKNIPVFAATGNDRRSDVVGFPSCVPGVIGVGAMANATQLERATNTGPGIDMVAPGKVTITKYNGSTIDTAGSSVATALSASSYVNRNTFKTFGEYLTSLSKILINNVSYIRN
jgi:hypothetical protein